MATNQKPEIQDLPEATSLAGALSAFGLATVSANDYMSRYKEPMIIREFYFGSFMNVDFLITEQLDITYIGNDVNVAEKHYSGIAQHKGIVVKCIFVPLAILKAESSGLAISK